jgi:N-acetylglucosaminyldiphosphoundecaprenol N-acetyl-beta-D-mannosaminyltransferase
VSVLGVTVDTIQPGEAIERMTGWIDRRERGRFVVAANVHMLVEARRHPDFGRVLRGADLVVPDGMPLVWVARRRGISLARRVPGPDLFKEFCTRTQGRRYRHYFYGGAPGVPERMIANLRQSLDLEVAGHCSPPFRPLTPEEDRAAVAAINAARPDIVWVGLGCPKQEWWISQHRDCIEAPVLAGIGQAFDIYADATQRAPEWLQRSGFEWLHRLWQDPRRLWRRYLIGNALFLGYLALEELGLDEPDA